ncbi:putative transcriptional regulatory protein C530,05 [Talaromyces islandicus]|uniref:Putative transcriptional regulatory protein C530,05 n=1 Tax=Talaromyces islandicus TaxID=28573 RepID=A0A0U1MB55_TALIS|nr:putative transcriptional regulatory protein C530,05 [Talaromyces islandicus]
MSQEATALPTREPAGRPPKRKYTNRACEECRGRRSKCDGKKPACSRCLARGVECSYTTGEDGRRPASKTYVQLLRRRIDHLERLLLSQGDADSPTIPRRSGSNDEKLTEANLSSDYEDICSSFEGALCLDGSLNFDGDGQPRYFGATSGRLDFQPLPSMSSDAQTGAHSIQSSDRRRFRSVFQELELETSSQIPEELESHLVDLYFSWEQPWKQVVDEKLFKESRRTEGKYFSPLLLNSILAFASRFCDRLEVRSDPDDPNTAGKLFLEKTEALLPFDLKWPTITTIQALAILGTLYVAIGSDAAGWLHQGMASRLALDMGFNHDPETFKGSLTPEEVELRRRIYWALYCDDKLSSSYTGRVCTMLDSQGAVKFPSTMEIPVMNKKHIGPETTLSVPERDLLPLRRALATHCQILEKILLTLYAPKSLIRESQRRSFCNSCILELKNWFYDLPAELRIDRPRTGMLPQVFTLHMVHYTAFILLLKPFIFAGEKGTLPKADAPSNTGDPATESPLSLCHEAARQICIVARKYRQVFGSFRKSPITATHCTLSAALFLLKKMKYDGDETKISDRNLFQACLKTLAELGISWYPAWRYWKNLSDTFAASRNSAGDSAISDSPASSGLDTYQNPLQEVQGVVREFPTDGQGVTEFPQSSRWSNTMDWAINLPEDLNISAADGQLGDLTLDASYWPHVDAAFMFDSLPADYTNFNTFN